MTGCNLPPGCTDRMVDEAAGGYDEPKYDGEEEEMARFWDGYEKVEYDDEEEGEEPARYDCWEEGFLTEDEFLREWKLYAGPFVSLDVALEATRSLNEYSLRDRSAFRGWRFSIWPDPATATKWIIKRRKR